MHLDMGCVDSFIVLSRERHYGRAAASLNMTRSSLTKQIQRLERQLGVRLLDRGPDGVAALTLAGAEASRHLTALLEHERRIRGAALGRTTTLVLGLPHDGTDGPVAAPELADVGQLLRAEHPDVALVCRRTPLPCLTTWLLDGAVDVQLTAGPVRHRGVHSAPVGPVTRIAAVPAGSDLRDAAEVAVDDFLDQVMIYDPELPDEFMRPFWLGDMRPAAQARLVSIVARDSSTVLQYVARGVGATVLLAPQAATVPPGLTVLPLVGAAPLVVHAARRVADRRSVVHALVAALQALPPLGHKEQPPAAARTGDLSVTASSL